MDRWKRDISKYFGYFVKTATKWLCLPQFCSRGVGDYFEGHFPPESYNVTPETDMHTSQLLDLMLWGVAISGFTAVRVS